MNAFSQNEFKDAYKAAPYQQLRSLADHCHSEARELLALGLSDDQVANVSSPNQLRLFAIISMWFWAYSERSYEAWAKAGRPHTGI